MNILKRLLIILIIPTLLFRCDKKDENVAPGKVQFTFSPQMTDISSGRTTDLPAGAHLLVSIETSRGSQVYNRQSVDLLSVGGQLISTPFALPQGGYLITEFFLVSTANEILYATPKAGSVLAGAIKHPLPITFTVSENKISNLAMEVIDVTTSPPEDFGFVSFRVDTVHVQELRLALFIAISNSIAPASGNAFILKNGVTLHKYPLAPKVNSLFLTEDPDEEFTLTVIRDGYSRYTRDFTYNQLIAELDGKPLTVLLQKAFTMVALAQDPWLYAPYTFSMNITGPSTGKITVDWGDGTVETDLRDHTYNTPGKYFISITGDIDKITEFYSFYGQGPVERINFEHLPELVDLRLGLTASPKIVDLTHNKKLIHINMAGCNDLEVLRLASDNRIFDLAIEGPNHMGTPAVDDIINKLYQSVLIDGRRGGYFNLNVLWYEYTFHMVGPPSPEAVHKLDVLRIDYDWNIAPPN